MSKINTNIIYRLQQDNKWNLRLFTRFRNNRIEKIREKSTFQSLYWGGEKFLLWIRGDSNCKNRISSDGFKRFPEKINNIK